MLTYTGVLKAKSPEVKVSEKFKKREFVLTDNAASYPQCIMFQLTQDRCSLIDNDKIGDGLTVHFQLKGREWKNPQGELKYFNTLDVFRIEGSRNDGPTEDTSLSDALTPTPDSDLPF